MVVAVDADPHVRAIAQRRRDVRRGEGAPRRPPLRLRLAEARAERAVVGLDLVGAELVGLRDVAQLLDVELAEHDALEAVDRRPPRPPRAPPPRPPAGGAPPVAGAARDARSWPSPRPASRSRTVSRTTPIAVSSS